MSIVDHSIYLFLHFLSLFPKFSFSNKLWYFLKIFIWPTFANICRSEFLETDFKNACCFFILGLMLFWSRVQQKHPDEKSMGDFQSWESNRGQQWLSRTAKNLSRFLLRTKLRLIFERENRNFFVAHSMARVAYWKNGNMASLIDRSRW